ncbi:MAG TPA: RteC domain-containing protein [Chitinophagaceae bacterium]|jgi:hypothetical protein
MENNKAFNFWRSDIRRSVEELYEKLPTINIDEMYGNTIETIEDNLNIIQLVIADLISLVENHTFKDEKEEIIFFKHIKPKFYSSFFYWKNLLTLYLHKPVGNEAITNKYFSDKLDQLKSFFDSNLPMYEYLRGNHDHLDQLYFLRSSSLSVKTIALQELNPKMATAKDRNVSEIYANDQLVEYITRVTIPKKADSIVPGKKNFDLKWTASNAGLVELIYALQASGVLNNGNVGIKELSGYFQQIFGVELGNYYHVFNEIRLRKKNRTSLLDHLKERVIQKMDTMDEK